MAERLKGNNLFPQLHIILNECVNYKSPISYRWKKMVKKWNTGYRLLIMMNEIISEWEKSKNYVTAAITTWLHTFTYMNNDFPWATTLRWMMITNILCVNLYNLRGHSMAVWNEQHVVEKIYKESIQIWWIKLQNAAIVCFTLI